MRAAIVELPIFLKELDQSLSVIPNEQYIPTNHLGPLKEGDDFLGYAVSYRFNEEVCFCGLGNISESKARSIALAHLLSNVHLLRKLIDRYDCALDVAVKSLVNISVADPNDGTVIAQKAVCEIAAIKEHAVR